MRFYNSNRAEIWNFLFWYLSSIDFSSLIISSYIVNLFPKNTKKRKKENILKINLNFQFKNTQEVSFIQGQGTSNSSSSPNTPSTSASTQQQGDSGKSNNNNNNMDSSESTPNLTHATRVSPATVRWCFDEFLQPLSLSLTHSSYIYFFFNEHFSNQLHLRME